MMENEKSGVFRIISDDETRAIFGTAFSIKLLDTQNVFYLLTAYHVISELEAKNKSIIVEDESGKCHTAQKIFPTNLSKEYRQFGQDYALLMINSYDCYRSFEIAVAEGQKNCLIRGAVSHYSTNFTNVEGRILGEESIANERNKVLQIQLYTNLVYDELNTFKPMQQVLRGLSGAPVLVEMDGENVCVGVMGNLERDYSGSRGYAVSTRYIANDCLKHLHVNYRLFNQKEKYNISYNLDAFVELIIGDTAEFLFADERLEQEAWNKLSDLYYKGISVDISLSEVLNTKIFDAYNSEVKCALMYFYARIMFKCGKKMVGFRTFEQISKLLPKVSDASKTKLKTLIDCRYVIEKKIDYPQETLTAIRQAGDKIINLPNVSEDYMCYELSSMCGRGLTNLFSLNIDFSNPEKEDILRIFLEHQDMLIRHPIKLGKQDVVNTSLQWYLGYWEIKKDFSLESEHTAIYKGFEQSKWRKNSIFYIQSVISYSIYFACTGQIIRATKFLLLSVKLMHKERVHLDHEGIKQLLLILKHKYIALYTFFSLAYNAASDEYFLSKASLLNVDLGINSFANILNCVKECYAIKYADERIYNIEVKDLEFFL